MWSQNGDEIKNRKIGFDNKAWIENEIIGIEMLSAKSCIDNETSFTKK